MKRRILAVATNASPELHYGKTGLWLSELTHFTDVMTTAGHEVDVVSPAGGAIPLDVNSANQKQLADPANARFLADPKGKQALASSKAIGDVDARSYDAIYLSGGHGTMWDFRTSKPLQKAITEMHDAGKWITGVCHGVCGFIDAVDGAGASLVKNKRVTGFSNFEDRLAGSLKFMPYRLEDELKKQGAEYHKNFLPFTSRVEVVGKLITGQNPQSAKALGEKLLEQWA